MLNGGFIRALFNMTVSVCVLRYRIFGITGTTKVVAVSP